MKKLFLFASLFFLSSIYSQSGNLDISFGTDGKNVSCHIDQMFEASSAIQSSGKLISFGRNFSTTNGIYLLRYNVNGNLDTTFGTNGFVGDNQFGQTFAGGPAVLDMVILPDDKILLLVRKSQSASNNYIVRLTANGAIDNTFNGTGILNFGIGSGLYYDWAITMQLQPDGKILVGGTSEAPVGMFYTLVRLNSNGTFDSTFGTNGKVHTQIFNGQSGLRSIVVLPSGKIVTGGYCNDGATTRYVLVQYSANGSLDTTFGANGIAAVPALQTFRWDELRKILVRPDGKILVGGLTNSLGQPNAIRGLGLTQYLANGTVDTSFGTNGVKIIPDTDLGDMALQVDGKIILTTPDLGFGVVRTLPNGTIDTTFGTAGYVNEFLNAPGRSSSGVLIQADNKIIVTGQVNTGPDQNGSYQSCLSAMRLNPGVILKNDNFSSDNGLVVYPNPSDGKLFIESKSFLDEDFTLDVYSVLGQKVFSETNIKLESKEIDLSALNSGTYFIKLSNDFRALQQTLVIK